MIDMNNPVAMAQAIAQLRGALETAINELDATMFGADGLADEHPVKAAILKGKAALAASM